MGSEGRRSTMAGIPERSRQRRKILRDTGRPCTYAARKPAPATKTEWEWMEFYGPLNASANKVHGTWQEAREEVESRLEEIFPAEKQEKMLAATKKTALTKKYGI